MYVTNKLSTKLRLTALLLAHTFILVQAPAVIAADVTRCADKKRNTDSWKNRVVAKNNTDIPFRVSIYRLDYEGNNVVASPVVKRNLEPGEYASYKHKLGENAGATIKVVFDDYLKNEAAICQYQVHNQYHVAATYVSDGKCTIAMSNNCKNCTVECDVNFQSSKDHWTVTFDAKPK